LRRGVDNLTSQDAAGIDDARRLNRHLHKRIMRRSARDQRLTQETRLLLFRTAHQEVPRGSAEQNHRQNHVNEKLPTAPIRKAIRARVVRLQLVSWR
jgi:hypothetical protein